jgi:hypothetical protein
MMISEQLWQNDDADDDDDEVIIIMTRMTLWLMPPEIAGGSYGRTDGRTKGRTGKTMEGRKAFNIYVAVVYI